MDKTKVKAFLAELTELTQKHGLVIDACGCCGSPWIRKIEESQKGKPYIVEKYSEHWQQWERLELERPPKPPRKEPTEAQKAKGRLLFGDLYWSPGRGINK